MPRGADASRWRPAPVEILAAIALLACALLLAWIPMRTLDPAGDEVAHIGAAYDTLMTGKERLNREHPALMKRLAGVGIRWHEGDRLGERMARMPSRLGQWEYGKAVLYPEGRVDEGIIRAARLPLLPMVALGGLGVWLWSRALFGAPGGLLSLALYAGSPAVAAYGSLVISDFLLAVFALLQFALLWQAWRRGSWLVAALAGVAGALACYSKYSGPVAVILGMLLLLLPNGGAEDRGRSYWRRRLVLVGAYGASAGALALVFAGPHCVSEYLLGVGKIYEGFVTYRYFALGAASEDGFWYYFPLTLLLKSTPAELLALLAVAILAVAPGASSSRDASPSWRDHAWLWLFPAVYLCLLSSSAMNLGHRYTAPLYPFAFVAIGALARAALPKLRVLLPAGLVAVQALSAVLATPDPLTYFNGLLGCSGARAARCLDDSNVDWEQNNGRLAAGLRERLGDEVPVIGARSPDPLAMRARVPHYLEMTYADWRRPRPALYAISGHYLVRIWVMDPSISDSPLFQALMRGDSITRSFLVADMRQPTRQ